MHPSAPFLTTTFACASVAVRHCADSELQVGVPHGVAVACVGVSCLMMDPADSTPKLQRPRFGGGPDNWPRLGS